MCTHGLLCTQAKISVSVEALSLLRVVRLTRVVRIFKMSKNFQARGARGERREGGLSTLEILAKTDEAQMFSDEFGSKEFDFRYPVLWIG